MESNSGKWNDLLIKIAEHRDKQAFSCVFAHFAPLIKGFLMKGVSISHEQAEELAQETMIKVWRKAASFDSHKASANTWIYSIARNCRIDWFRREARRRVELDADDLYDLAVENPSQDALERNRNQMRLSEKIQALPRDQLDVIAKIYFEGKTHSEVALELMLPLGTVKSRIRLALKKMNFQFNNEGVSLDR